jgi:hypothetical protein
VYCRHHSCKLFAYGVLPCRADYDIPYGNLLKVVAIAVLSFASLAQKLPVDFLRAKDNRSGNWYEEFLTGDKGRYCLCHAGHGGSSNNMGVEVDWRYVKKQCPPSATLGTFLGTLFQFIKQLGLEHCEHLEQQGTPENSPLNLQVKRQFRRWMMRFCPSSTSILR